MKVTTATWRRLFGGHFDLFVELDTGLATQALVLEHDPDDEAHPGKPWRLRSTGGLARRETTRHADVADGKRAGSAWVRTLGAG